jgi:hypothetical protein
VYRRAVDDREQVPVALGARVANSSPSHARRPAWSSRPWTPANAATSSSTIGAAASERGSTPGHERQPRARGDELRHRARGGAVPAATGCGHERSAAPRSDIPRIRRRKSGSAISWASSIQASTCSEVGSSAGLGAPCAARGEVGIDVEAAGNVVDDAAALDLRDACELVHEDHLLWRRCAARDRARQAQHADLRVERRRVRGGDAGEVELAPQHGPDRRQLHPSSRSVRTSATRATASRSYGRWPASERPTGATTPRSA